MKNLTLVRVYLDSNNDIAVALSKHARGSEAELAALLYNTLCGTVAAKRAFAAIFEKHHRMWLDAATRELIRDFERAARSDEAAHDADPEDRKSIRCWFRACRRRLISVLGGRP